jgi:hypothetical protein
MKQKDKKGRPEASAPADAGAAWGPEGLDAGALSLENAARVPTGAAKTLEALARGRKDRKRPPRG